MSRGIPLLLCLVILTAMKPGHFVTAIREPADDGGQNDLPSCLDFSYRNDPGFLPYEVTMDYDKLIFPLADDIEMKRNDVSLPEFSPEEKKILTSFFPSRHFVSIPQSARITTKKNGDGDLVWDFPEGTTFIHEIYLDKEGKGSDFSTIFEVRVEKKVHGVFRFGAYETGQEKCPAGSLSLRTEPIKRVTQVSAPQSAFGKVKIRFQPLSPKSCLGCHNMEGGSADEIQPCDFGLPSSNPETDSFMGFHVEILPWIAAYEKKFGHSPVSP